MVRLFNLLLVCGAQFLAEFPLTQAEGLTGQGSAVAGARFGQGSGSRGGLGCGCCCEEPEPEPESPVECNPQCKAVLRFVLVSHKPGDANSIP
jgi:hypothetical protein